MRLGSRTVARALVSMVLGALLAGTGCEGCDDEGPDCTAETCSGHGTCEVIGGATVCTCADAYEGAACDECASGFVDDGDGACVPACDAEACGAHQHCEADGGEARCLCDDGYQDGDGDGECAPDCATAGLECGEHQSCDDSSGEALCACDDGYQDHDGDGECAPDCATAGLACGGLGCDDSSGTARCLCAEGSQDHDGDGVCRPDCATAGLDCHGRGACVDSGGTARCTCEDGYTRSDCSVCESAYFQDNDGDGECTPTCYASTATFVCGENQVCSHASGDLECVCADGTQDNDGNGTCLPTCQSAQADESAPLVCPDQNGGCDDTGGVASCRCDAGYADDPAVAGDDCLGCAVGYQANGVDGRCRPDCATVGLDCGALGCDDSSGVARCVCVEGEQDNDGDGTCEAVCATAAIVCDPAEGLVCSDASGQAVCTCDAGAYDDGMGACHDVGGGDGDRCVDEIDLDPTVSRFYSDLTGADDDHVFGCETRDRAFRDNFYRVHVEPGESRRLRFTVERIDAFGASFSPAVAILDGDDCATASEIACAVGGLDPATGVRIEASAEATLEGGASGADYHVVVGMYDRRGLASRAIVRVDHVCDVGAAYSPALDACVDDPCASPNPCVAAHRSQCVADLSGAEPTYECGCDLGYSEDPSAPGTCAPNPSTDGEGCADVTPIDASAGAGSVSGSTAAAADDGEGSCGGDRPARDRVYGFVVERETRVTFHLSCDPAYDCLLHLRAACDDDASELLCSDTAPEGQPEQLSTTLDPGAYFLFVDGWNSRADDALSDGDYTLEYAFHTDPCLDEEAACPGDPLCTAAADWSVATCTCETEGDVYHEGSCVDDPCDPDPCVGIERQICQADLDAGTSACVCGGVYVSDGAGGCVLDAEAEWTVFWYLAADNNLYYQNTHEIDDIVAAGLSPDVRVVGLIDRWDASEAYYAEFGPGTVDAIEELGDIDTGDFNTLRDFGVWAVENYPAKHYALVISDHGGAWRNDEPGPAPQPPALRAICWDDHSETPDDGIGVTNGQLAQALEGITTAAGRALDLVIYDACLMGEWEIANATAPYADYMIASPESSYGFMVRYGAWTDWLDTVVAGAETLSPLDVGEAFVDNYRATLETDPRYVTTAALTDLATVPELNEAVSDFADALAASESDTFYAALDEARLAAQHTAYNELVDLEDFARLVTESADAPAAVVDAADALGTQLDWSIVYSFANIDLDGWSPYYGSMGLGGHNGLTVYLPGRYYQMAAEYTEPGAVWSAQASWDEFLASFLTGGYAACSGAEPALSYLGDDAPRTVRLANCCQSEFLAQSFRAPGTELHGVRIAVIKVAGDAEEHQGFYFAINRPGHGIVWGPAHWEVGHETDDPQFFCMARMGVPTEPGEELQILLGGGDPYGPAMSIFSTPILWPIEYADSAGADPPYAEGQARVINADGNVTVGEYNGDGVEGTFWFEVY